MAIDRVVTGGKLQLSGKPLMEDGQPQADIISLEAIVSPDSPFAGLSAKELALSYTRGVNLLAISRRGERLKERLGGLTLATWDVLLVQGSRTSLTAMLQDFSLLPLAQREVLLGSRRRAFIPLVILALAMATTAVGLAPVPVAFFAAALGMVAFRAIPLTDFYKSVDGSILVMLAALIPVSDSLRTTGGSELIAGWLGWAAASLPPWAALALILITAMAVTPFLNNAATVLVMDQSRGRSPQILVSDRNLPDGWRDRGWLRLPHPSWPPVQHAGVRTWRIQVFRLSATRSAAFPVDHFRTRRWDKSIGWQSTSEHGP